MKSFLFLSIAVCFLSSCSEQPVDQLAATESKFNEAWQSDSAELVIKIRSDIAVESPRSEFGLYCKAWILSKKGEKDKALKTADSLVMGFPAFDKGIYLRANLKADQNNPDGALKDFDLCLKKNPAFFEALVNRGSLYFKTDHPEMAQKDFEKANKLRPNNKMVLLNLGNASIALGKQEDACAFWHRSDSLGEPQATVSIANFCNHSPLK